MLRVLRMVEERFHRDVEDRPIREGHTPAEFLREGDIEYKTCPIAVAMGQGTSPAATWRALDAIFGRVVAHVEAGLGTTGDIELSSEIRDRLIGASPRAMFDRIG